MKTGAEIIERRYLQLFAPFTESTNNDHYSKYDGIHPTPIDFNLQHPCFMIQSCCMTQGFCYLVITEFNISACENDSLREFMFHSGALWCPTSSTYCTRYCIICKAGMNLQVRICVLFLQALSLQDQLSASDVSGSQQ